MALPKHHRLRHRRDFNRVYRSGLRRKSRHLTLRALKVVRQVSDPVPDVAAKAQKQTSASMAVTDAGHRQQGRPSHSSSPNIQPTRIGITISTKVSKRATVRNRIKRQIKSAMMQLLPTLSPGWLIVIIVRPGMGECDYWQFLRELEEMIKSLR